MPATLSRRTAAVCSRIQAGRQHFSVACVCVPGCAPSRGGVHHLLLLLLCRRCCAPSLRSGWREWNCLEILASPCQQELLEVLAEMRACTPSGQPNVSLNHVKGKGHSLKGMCPPCLGQPVAREVCCWCRKLFLHPPVLTNAKIIRRGGKGSLLLMTAWQMGFILSNCSPGVVSHTFVTCRCGDCHGVCLCSVTSRGRGGQIATLSSPALKSGEELQAPGLLQSVENSAASLLHNTACG